MSSPSRDDEASDAPSGAALAAVLAASLGLLALAMAHVLSEVSVPFKNAMQSLGNLWMPGAAGIGPYSGKETAALLVWWLSWAALHAAWKRRELSVGGVAAVALVLIGVATTLVWPPITELFVHH
ncbi:MAG: hypothetical protein HY353_01005 [Candidatus Omnitrophica bacterium]|nr:hypothetical protein [Candidatus Omnitrophota bacterium]